MISDFSDRRVGSGASLLDALGNSGLEASRIGLRVIDLALGKTMGVDSDIVSSVADTDTVDALRNSST